MLRDRLGEYRDALGPDGWDALRRAAQEAWSDVPARQPGDEEPDRYGHRFRLVRVMEALAGDDLNALLEVRARSLAHPYDWVRIIETCASAGRDDLAIEWGERGLAAFGHDTDPRLPDALSDAYARAGRHSDALALERHQFRRAPATERYARLRAVAEPLGSWPAERETAHRIAREHVTAAEEGARSARRQFPWWEPPASLIVALLLEDGEVEQAWAEASRGGCSDGLWQRLADLRAHDHPDDAIAVYRRRLDRTLEPAKNAAYDAVVDVLLTLQPLYAHAGRPDDFRRLVEQIRAGYRRRPNLMKRLDRSGL